MPAWTAPYLTGILSTRMMMDSREPCCLSPLPEDQWERAAEMKPVQLCPTALVGISFQELHQAGPWTAAQIAPGEREWGSHTPPRVPALQAQPTS